MSTHNIYFCGEIKDINNFWLKKQLVSSYGRICLSIFSRLGHNFYYKVVKYT